MITRYEYWLTTVMEASGVQVWTLTDDRWLLTDVLIVYDLVNGHSNRDRIIAWILLVCYGIAI